MKQSKTIDFYEKLIEKILKTNLKRDEKAEILKMFVDSVEKINCYKCAYGVKTCTRKQIISTVKCKYSGEVSNFEFTEFPDKDFFAECPYKKLSMKLKSNIR